MAYCPWANGAIEVVGKDLIHTMKNLLSEYQASIDEWDLLLPVVTYAINHRPRKILGGRSSVHIMTGRKPKTTVDMILFTGPSLKNSQRHQLSMQQLQKHIDELDKSITLLHETARTQEDKQRRRRAQKACR